MFKRRGGGGGSKAFWTMLKKTALFLHDGFPYWVGFRISLSREGAIFRNETRIIFLALTWRDEIEIIIWPFSYFETRPRLHIVILVFRDKIKTLENYFSLSSENKWSLLSSRIPWIENSCWTLLWAFGSFREGKIIAQNLGTKMGSLSTLFVIFCTGWRL